MKVRERWAAGVEAIDWDEVGARVEVALERGTGAARQRRALERRGRLEDVVELILTETASGVGPVPG